MQTISIILGVIVLIFGAGYLVTNSPNDTAPTETVRVSNGQSDVVTITDAQESSAAADSTEPEDPETPADSDGEAEVTPGTYANYDAAAIANSDADHILLFFHATWCPSCRALDADITANADAIPGDVAIFKTDYDTSTDLKRQYGVTTQHSIIAIDAAGNAVSSISHPRTLAGVLDTI